MKKTLHLCIAFQCAEMHSNAKLCTAMITKGRQLSKRLNEHSLRFKMVYERLSFTQKRALKQQFIEAHGITKGTFRNKVNGSNPVSASEADWMDAYDPYAQTIVP